MDDAKKAMIEFATANEVVGYDNAARIVTAVAIGWGLAQVAKGLMDIGKGINEIAVAAKLGCFQ